MKRVMSVLSCLNVAVVLCATSDKVSNKCNRVDPEVVSFVTRVVAPLAHLYDLSEDELTAVHSVVDWSQCVDDDCKELICSDALASAVDKVSRDEVMAKMMCFAEYVGDDSRASMQLLKRSQICSCPCPSVQDFLDECLFVKVCNISADKVATDQLLTSNTACFNGPVQFATSVCGVPGGLCWNPVLCPEWSGSLTAIPCPPECGQIVLNSFTASSISRIAVSYQSKDGVDERCRLKALANALNFLADINVGIFPALLLFDANGPLYSEASVALVKIVDEIVADDSGCFIAVAVDLDLVTGSTFGVFDQTSCIGLAQLPALDS